MKERVKREEHFQGEVASIAWDEVRGWPALCRAACFMNHRMVEFLSWLLPQRIACTHARSIVFNLRHQLPACLASEQYFCEDKRKTKLVRAQHFFFCIVVLYSSDCWRVFPVSSPTVTTSSGRLYNLSAAQEVGAKFSRNDYQESFFFFF